MAQFSTSTRFNRYPGVFRTVRERVAQKHGPGLKGGALKILSFGCSMGSELMSLRCYFPDATLFGCDVDHDSLRNARRQIADPDTHLFESTPAAVEEFAPYDVIFAMSVLCRWGLSRTANRLDKIYPFEQFLADVETLHCSLNEKGLFCCYNANYFFTHTPFSASYSPIRSNLLATNGFVDKWDPSGERITSAFDAGAGLEHALVGNPRSVTDRDFTDCIFEKEASAPIEIGLGHAEPSFHLPTPLRTMLTGPDLHVSAAERRIAACLERKVFRLADGRLWARREWSKSGVAGRLMALGPYWREASLAEAGTLTPYQEQSLYDGKRSGSLELSSAFARIRRTARHRAQRFLARWQ